MSEQLYITHVSITNEDLFRIAELYYGNHSLWWIIYHANLEEIGDDPEALAPGTSLKVPYLATARERVDLPAYFNSQFPNAFDSLIQLADDRFDDKSLYFDLLETNDLEGTETIAAGTIVKLPPLGHPQQLKLAQMWRAQFYRGRDNAGS